MLARIIGGQAAESCTVCVDDADLAGGLQFKKLTGVNDPPLGLFGVRGSWSRRRGRNGCGKEIRREKLIRLGDSRIPRQRSRSRQCGKQVSRRGRRGGYITGKKREQNSNPDKKPFIHFFLFTQ